MTCRPLVWLAPGVAIALASARPIIIASPGKERSGGDADGVRRGVPCVRVRSGKPRSDAVEPDEGRELGTFRRRMAAARPGGRRDCLFELLLSRWAGTGPGPRRLKGSTCCVRLGGTSGGVDPTYERASCDAPGTACRRRTVRGALQEIGDAIHPVNGILCAGRQSASPSSAHGPARPIDAGSRFVRPCCLRPRTNRGHPRSRDRVGLPIRTTRTAMASRDEPSACVMPPRDR